MSGAAPGTQSIDRAGEMLARLLESDAPMSLRELAEAADLPKSTASRLLTALERHGLVHQAGERGKLEPSPAILRFAHRGGVERHLVELAEQSLEALSRATGETINLAVPTPTGVEHLAQVDASAINLQIDPPGGSKDESRRADDNLGPQLPARREPDAVRFEAIDLISHDRDGSCLNCAEEISVGRYAKALVPRLVARSEVLLHNRPADLLGDRPQKQLCRSGRPAPAVLPEDLLSKDGVESPETIRGALGQRAAEPGA